MRETEAQKILIVAPAWVGDMVMSQVLYQCLAAQGPVILDVVAPKHSGPLAARMPELNAFIELPLGHGDFAWGARRALGHRLRDNHYDQAIVLPNSWKSALVPWFANIPVRTGWLGEMRWGLLNDARHLDPKRYPLMIERFAALAYPKNAPLPAELPWPSLKADPDNLARVLSQMRMPLSGKPILGLCPGAEFGPAKRWPEAYFAEVAKQKLAQGWEVWLFGSPKEKPQADLIQSVTGGRCVDLVGKTALADAIDLMSATTAIISNDSGLMHIAAALGKPVVVMYGSSSPRFTPPLSHAVKILNLELACSPCFKRECPLGHLNCLKQMHPEQVLSALDSLVHPNKTREGSL
jgi:heptosyltransferase-2